MSKTLKRTLAIVMAIAMIFSLSATAFAAQPEQQRSTITCYVRLQSATAPNSWDMTLGTLTGVQYLTPYSQNTDYFYPVTVTKSGDITVKDVVEALYGVTVTECIDATHDSYGCVHSDTVLSGETACTCAECNCDDCDCEDCECAFCNCTWKRVKNMVWDPVQQTYIWDNTYASAMNSLNYLGNLYTNNSVTTGNSTHGTYTGTSWEYFVADNKDATAIYSTTAYMDQYVVDSSLWITLSFDTSSFAW